ncbi:hypothetical protein LCGC14_1513270 [marine sediment metagenome]|uniref:Uncharacterized protein n=1 Tax=marine sediment metagenome TaxID=412755 RepID=A0A0F9J0T2_9ZZZZ
MNMKIFYKLISRIKWLLNNKPMIKYSGFNCGCCGKWENEEFEVPTYRSGGEWWDTWGVCEECIKDAEEYS